MKVWVEIVAVDGRRIKTPVREDYEDRRDDDPIFAPHVVAEGFTYWVQDGYFGVPEHQRPHTRLGRTLSALGLEGVRSLGCIAHAGAGLYSFTVWEGYEEPLPAKWAKMIYGRLE
jgi:hypothetical protein